MQYFNFKNMIAYQISDIEKTNLQDVDSLLQGVLKATYRPLSKGQASLTTFSAINGNNANEPEYLHEIKDPRNETIGVALRVNIAKRDLPNKFVKNEIERRIKKLESAGQKLEKADKKRIKEDVVNELIDKAFPKEKEVDIFIDLRNGLVFVGASSASVAENCFAFIRKVLNTFPAIPIRYEKEIGRELDNIFLQNGTRLKTATLDIAMKFKLTELDTLTYSVTNNLTECPLQSLQHLVQSRELTVSQLELADKNNELFFIIVGPKVGGANMPTFKGIETNLPDLLNERAAGATDDVDEELLHKEFRAFSAEQMLKSMNKIVSYTMEMFN